MKSNLHSGHRERLLEKFNKNPDLLTDHELLEAILFMAIPRKDTNELAHKLIRIFGSLSNVFLASPTDLCAVDGIGLSIATKISLIGKTFERILHNKNKKVKIVSKEDVIKYVVSDFFNLKKECSRVYLLNARYGLLHVLDYNNDQYNRVVADPKEVVGAITAHKAKYILIAHNHPSGNLLPSINDDYATANFIKVCEIMEVIVLDHLIVADDEYYSYAKSGHLDEIKNAPSYYKMLATGKGY